MIKHLDCRLDYYSSADDSSVSGRPNQWQCRVDISVVVGLVWRELFHCASAAAVQRRLNSWCARKVFQRYVPILYYIKPLAAHYKVEIALTELWVFCRYDVNWLELGTIAVLGNFCPRNYLRQIPISGTTYQQVENLKKYRHKLVNF